MLRSILGLIALGAVALAVLVPPGGVPSARADTTVCKAEICVTLADPPVPPAPTDPCTIKPDACLPNPNPESAQIDLCEIKPDACGRPVPATPPAAEVLVGVEQGAIKLSDGTVLPLR